MSFYFIESFRKKKFWELLLVFIRFILKSWIPSGIWSSKVSFSVDKKSFASLSWDDKFSERKKDFNKRKMCHIVTLCFVREKLKYLKDRLNERLLKTWESFFRMENLTKTERTVQIFRHLILEFSFTSISANYLTSKLIDFT